MTFGVFSRIIVLFSAVVLIPACVKEVKDISQLKDENTGALETVPYYQKGTAMFDTRASVRQAEEEATQAIRKRLAEDKKKPGDTKIFDPWLPPDDVQSEKLSQALKFLPKDKYGYPDWTAAVQRGILKPKDSIPVPGAVQAPSAEGDDKKAESQKEFDMDIIFEINDRLMANVRFPHKTHTFWLSCNVCHPAIFKPQKGANVFTMYDIWEGRYCGRCHGKVAFQPKGFYNCQRCHSVKKKTMGVK